MEPLDLTSALHSYVNTATVPEDLFQILRFVKIDDLKAFAHGQIDKFKEMELQTAYHSGLPLKTVLPEDVMQHILTFEDFYSNSENRIICNQWNRLYQKNEENMLRTLYDKVNETYPEPLTPENDTWIWHDARRRLHPMEQRLGYRGPVYGLDEVDQHCKSGDRVLVHRNVCFKSGYTEHRIRIFTKDIHFIGLSSITFGQCPLCLDVKVFGHVILENLTLVAGSTRKYLRVGTEMDDARSSAIVGTRSLSIKYCDIICEKTIKADPLGNLDVQHCTLSSRSTTSREWMAIGISQWANNVNIRNNRIKNFVRGIGILPYRSHKNYDFGKIYIEDNVFEDIKQYAVVQAEDRTDNIENQRSRIEGTYACSLRGYTCESKLIDPNQLHYVNVADFGEIWWTC